MKKTLNKFNGKKVLITGNTGFKGSWLSFWLTLVGAKVFGYSNNIPTNPSLYDNLNLKNFVNQTWGDIRNYNELNNLINKVKPDYIFHLAAQSIVKVSYDDPINTFTTNIVGTLNLLQSLLHYEESVNVIIITSDKSYKNIEQLWGYKENDIFGGDDPYSASKASTEMVIEGYFKSFFLNKKNVKIAVGRAGNVIGGGDWSPFRLVPDAIKSWSKNNTLELRNPNATRPWQHVLEPLSGYLVLANKISNDNKCNLNSFNFGPKFDQNFKVITLLNKLSSNWGNAKISIQKNKSFKESSLLKLNCEKADLYLGWRPILSFDDNVRLTVEWYKEYFINNNISELTKNQIDYYVNLRGD